jgi:predicted outer membrane protein
MRRFLLILAPLAAVALTGCIAKTAVDLVTLPVRATVAVVGAGVDAVTTSQAEADRAAGRRMRQEDERRGREAREAQRREQRAAREERDRQPD